MQELSHLQNWQTRTTTHLMQIVALIIVLSCVLNNTANAKELTLVWSDEFNSQGPVPPDPSKWGYEIGFKRNGEVGYFTSRLENVRVEGGMLVIEARKENYAGAQYTTGSINTRSRKNFKYGRYEIRAKMPYGYGSHVGLWFSGANYAEVGWPTSGELDVAEYVGRKPHTIHIYTHYANPANPALHSRTDVGEFTVYHPYNNFHIYAIEWDENEIKYFIDNIQVATFNMDTAGTGDENPFRKDMNFRITYALGGWGWEVDDRWLPQKFEVDYVRVYQSTTSMAPILLLLK